MCGRYWIDDGRESIELTEIIEAVNRRVAIEPVKTSGEIFPADIVPVVASNRRMTPTAFAMQWGYALPDGRRIINARGETAAAGVHGLVAPAQVAFEHEAHDRGVAVLDLRQHVVQHVALPRRVVGGVAVRAVDEDPLRLPGALELLLGARDVRRAVVGAAFGAAQHEVRVVVAAGVEDG